MNPRAFDFSDTKPSPDALAGSDALCYLGRSRPTQEYLDALARVGVPFTFIFETDPNRSQSGYQAGVFDAQFADGRADERSYPRADPIAVVVSDGNRFDPSSGGDRIADYGEGWARTCARPIFFYGNRYAVTAAIGGALRVSGVKLIAGPDADGGWLPTTWGADPARDLLGQEANIPSPIPGTDLNTVYNPYRAAPAPAPGPEPTPDPFDPGDNAMAILSYDGHEQEFSVTADGTLIHSSYAEAFGDNEVRDEALLRGNNPAVQPSARVVNGNIVVICQSQAGQHRRIVFLGGDKGYWVDEWRNRLPVPAPA